MKPAPPVTPEDVARLLEACGGGARGARNRAILVLLYRAGLRARELCELELGDLAEQGGGQVVRVETVKGGRPRVVGLDDKARRLLAEFLARRGEDPGPLFRSRTGRSLTPSYLRQLCSLLAARVWDGSRRLHPHCFRHTYAIELVAAGFNIREVQQLLGHRRLASTEAYLVHIGATDTVAAAQQRGDW
jgi:integrase